MRCLIIGSDSFIASNFIESYQNTFEIHGVSLKKSNLIKESVVDSFNDLDEKYFKNTKVVINFAAIVHKPQIKDDKLFDKINHELPVYLAKKAKETGVKQFIQFSTISVYGDQDNISDKTPYNPVSLYGISKLNADLDLLKLQDENFNICILRPSMVYGRGKAPGNMMSLIHLSNKPVPLPFKGIANSRQFAHVELVVSVLNKCIEKHANRIFLVADFNGISTFDLVSLIRKHLNKINLQVKLPKFILLIIEKIKPSLYQKLFSSLTIDVEETYRFLELCKKDYIEQGIREMVDWYLSQKNS